MHWRWDGSELLKHTTWYKLSNEQVPISSFALNYVKTRLVVGVKFARYIAERWKRSVVKPQSFFSDIFFTLIATSFQCQIIYFIHFCV